MSASKLELDQLLAILESLGYQPLGVLFRDPKANLLGIAPLEGVPDKFVEMIGKRLSGSSSSATVSWSIIQ